MNLRKQGDLLGRVLCQRITPELIQAARQLQCRLLPVAASFIAALGAFMWFIEVPSDTAFALSLVCVGAWVTTPLFVDLLIGMAARREIGVAHFIVASMIAMAGAFLLADRLMVFFGALVPPLFLAATVTGMCAPALLLGYSMWYCKDKTESRSSQS